MRKRNKLTRLTQPPQYHSKIARTSSCCKFLRWEIQNSHENFWPELEKSSCFQFLQILLKIFQQGRERAGNSNPYRFCSRFFTRVGEEQEIQIPTDFAHDFLLQYTYTFSNHWDKLWHIVGFAASPRIPTIVYYSIRNCTFVY